MDDGARRRVYLLFKDLEIGQNVNIKCLWGEDQMINHRFSPAVE